MQMRVALDKGNETKSDISRLISWGKSAGQKRSDNKRRARGEVQRRKQQRRILKAREHSKVHKAVNDNVHIYAAQPKRLSLLRVSSAPVNRPRSCTTFLQYKLPVYKYKCFLFHIVSITALSKFANIRPSTRALNPCCRSATSTASRQSKQRRGSVSSSASRASARAGSPITLNLSLSLTMALNLSLSSSLEAEA